MSKSIVIEHCGDFRLMVDGGQVYLGDTLSKAKATARRFIASHEGIDWKTIWNDTHPLHRKPEVPGAWTHGTIRPKRSWKSPA